MAREDSDAVASPVDPIRCRPNGSRDSGGRKLTIAQQTTTLANAKREPDDVALQIDARGKRPTALRYIDRGKATIAK